jgi:hypothetical protein
MHCQTLPFHNTIQCQTTSSIGEKFSQPFHKKLLLQVFGPKKAVAYDLLSLKQISKELDLYWLDVYPAFYF